MRFLPRSLLNFSDYREKEKKKSEKKGEKSAVSLCKESEDERES